MADEPKKGELVPQDESKALMTKEPGLARRKGTIFIGTLNIIGEPTRLLWKPIQKHFERKYLGKYRHAKKLFIFDLVLLATLLALAAIAAWALFFRVTLADKMTLTVEATPTEIVSGNQVTFTVFYENRSEETISNVDLTVLLPPHFEFLRSFPKDYNPRTSAVFLGTLAPGAHGQAKVTGILWGEVGKPTIVVGSLNFLSEKNQRHVKFVRTEIPVAHSVLVLSLELPSRIVAGQLIPFTLTFENTGPRDIPELSLAPQWPDGTTFVASEPPLREGQWRIGALASGASGRLTGAARLSSTKEAARSIGFLPLVTLLGDTLAQSPVREERTLIPEPLTLHATIEGAADTTVKPGADLTVIVAYENTGAVALENAAIGIEAQSSFVTNERLLIDAAANPALASLLPRATGTIRVPLKLIARPGGAGNEPQKNLLLEVTPIARYTLPDGIPVTVETQGATLTRRIETPLDLVATARYWTPEGDQIGRGPMPPVADETTKYWVFWQLLGTTNDLEHVQFQTTLPPNVEWTSRSNVTIGSPVVWNADTRAVTWTIDQLDATWGTGQVVTARFEVALTPTDGQVGTSPHLIGTTQATGRDLFTETNISTTAVPLTTSLGTDRRAAGKGVVQAP